MKTLRRLVLAVVLACLAAPVQAADTYTLAASAARTAAGTGSAVDVHVWKTVLVTVNVTAGSGTVTVFRVWLEGTNDNSTFYEMPCDLVMKTGAAAPGAASANQRDIANETTLITSQKYLAICQTWTTTVRAAWNITGTTPSETFTVLVSGK